MSASPMREFLPALRELERRLSVPVPERVRILRELEYDLEELRARFVAGGLSAEAARHRALEALVPGEAAVRQLEALHAPVYRRLTRRVRDDRLRVLERSALVLATAAVLAVEGLLLARSGILRVPPHLLWPVLGTGALLFAAIAATAFRLWIKRDHGPSPVDAGVILGLAGAVLVVGIAGGFIDAYRVLGALAAAPELAGTLVPRWLMRSAALLAVSLLIAAAGAMAWFVMTQWLAAVSAARQDVLGLGPFHLSDGERDHG